MIVLGLNFGLHDPSAAVLDSGRLVALIEHERISRTRHARHEVPRESVALCLERAGLTARDIDAIAIGWDHALLGGEPLTAERFQLTSVLPKEFNDLASLPPVQYVRHHTAHAASAFWSSGFEGAAILVVDGQGEDESISLWSGDRNELRLIKSYGAAVSPGHFYRAATQYAGLEVHGAHAEGKLMGLASYGKATEPMPLQIRAGVPWLDAELRPADGPNLRRELRPALRSWWAREAYPYRQGSGEEPMAYANFAASVQATLESIIVALAEDIRAETGSEDLAIAGGVAQNCAANGVLAAGSGFRDLFVHPVSHDSGVSLGAAQHVTASSGATTRFSRMTHAGWGTSYSNGACRAAIHTAGLEFEPLDEATLVRRVAAAIADGRIVGWFHGRAEIGPRALGARSLLADPRRRENLLKLNAIKQREVWRPLAPSVLEERFAKFFTSPVASPFMNIASNVRPDVRSLIPAVVHVDGTARPQAVRFVDLPRYWRLIHSFEELTGIPIVINTSFNLAGEPIVHTPDHAVRAFLESDIDVLVLEDNVVTK